MSARAEKIRELLVVDEEALLEQLLARVKRLLILTGDGKVHILVDRTKLTIKELIGLYLIGKKFSHDAQLVEEDTASLDELSRELGLDIRATAARLTELKREGKAESRERGLYCISPLGIEKILDEVESRLQVQP